MFRDAWDIRRADTAKVSERLREDVSAIQQKIDRVVDRLVDADTETLVKAYEARIEGMQHERRVIEDRIKNADKPPATFEDTFELAMKFLSNPWKIWDFGHLGLRRIVLNLALAEPLTYDRKAGLRTAKTTLPFNMLGSFFIAKCGLVEPRGIEPLTSTMPL